MSRKHEYDCNIAFAMERIGYEYRKQLIEEMEKELKLPKNSKVKDLLNALDKKILATRGKP